jgi:hypothetical protein
MGWKDRRVLRCNIVAHASCIWANTGKSHRRLSELETGISNKMQKFQPLCWTSWSTVIKLRIVKSDHVHWQPLLKPKHPCKLYEASRLKERNQLCNKYGVIGDATIRDNWSVLKHTGHYSEIKTESREITNTVHGLKCPRGGGGTTIITFPCSLLLSD